MRPVAIKQIIVVAGACLLFAVLFFAETRPRPEADTPGNVNAENAGIEQAISKALDSIPPSEQGKVKSWIGAKKKGLIPVPLLDSLIAYWSISAKPVIAAWYAEKKAEQTQQTEDWFQAGKRYHSAARFAGEQEKTSAYSPAIRCLMRAYSKDSLNLQLKTELGICFVEGSADPMKGITMLRDVLQKDPRNLDAQFNMGLFSVKSGQFDKAIERFYKVLEIDPSKIEVYLFIANTFERMKEPGKAIEALEKYMSLVTDTTVKAEVQNYINNLKQNH